METKKALIFCVSGQDGEYLSKLLLNKNYKVFGVTRSKNKKNILNLIKLKLEKQINLILLKKLEKKRINKLIKKISPTEIYY